MRKIFTILFTFLITFQLQAQHTVYFNLSELFPIHDFELAKSTVNGQTQLRIEAIQADENLDKSIEGKYEFVINGFVEKVDFKNGIAALPAEMNSDILFLKHEAANNSIYHLYYVLAGFVIPIPLWLLIIIPLFIVIVALLIKRIIMLLLIVLFVLFIMSQGIDFSSFINLMTSAYHSLF